MTRKIQEAELSRLSELVAQYLGLHFPRERFPDLERGLCAAAEDHGSNHDVEGYLQKLLSSVWTQDQMEILAAYLTIGETYFFREKRSLEILQERIVPELIRAHASRGRPIRIWSAGCASGEEPYSIAIVLNKLMAGLKPGDVEILATDINTRSLQKASQGIYSSWSFRSTPPWVRRTCFETAANDRSAIDSALKKMVRFAPLNLANDHYAPLSNCTGGLDVIFCRNVLMYFTPMGMRKVIRQLYRYLAADGWLIVSPTETSHVLFSEFATVNLGDVTLYRKSPAALASAVGGVATSSIPSPEWTVQATIPLRTSGFQIIQETPDKESPDKESPDKQPDSVRAGLPAVCYGELLRLYEQGCYEAAGQMAATLLSQNGRDAQTMLLLARIYANQGKLAEALAWCDKAIAADKMAARAHYLRAMILQEQSSIAEALLALRHAVYVEPQFVLGHFALGNLTLKHGSPTESQKHFENVLLLLARYGPEDIVPESDGLPAGRLMEMAVTLSALKNSARAGELIRAPKQVSKLEWNGR
jgi:chemotaxis protein methyltransferase CheR